MVDLTSPIFGIPLPEESSGDTPQAMEPSKPKKRYVEKDPKHKGVAGVARDVLGTLGDFLLTRLKMPAMYAPAQQRRKLSAALENIETDPEASIAAVTEIDPSLGVRLREDRTDNVRQAAALTSAQAARAQAAEDRAARLAMAQAEATAKARSRAASALNTLTTKNEADRAKLYPALREQLLKAGKASGVDLSEDLPKEYDGFALDVFIDESIPVGTQRAQRLTEKRIEESARQADQRDRTTRRAQDISSADRKMSETGKNKRAADAETGKNNRAAVSETGKNNRAAAAIKAKSVKKGETVTIPRDMVINGVAYKKGEVVEIK
jgi:hypothetical protein